MKQQHLLEKAIYIALVAHKGQKDKGGFAYILHPLRIMNLMETTEEKIVALLHDVVEDSDITIQYLAENGYPDKILTAIKILTKKENQPYFDYILAIKRNRLASKIKKADLKDNMNKSRLKIITENDMARLKKYKIAYKMLLEE